MNLTMVLDMAADAFGDRAVLGRRAEALTACRLRDLAAGGARRIRESGADSLVHLAVNGPAFPVALFAAALAGVPLVPVNYRLGAGQLDQVLANHPRALGIADPGQAAVLTRAGISARTPRDWLTEAAGQPPEPAEPAGGDAPAAIIYTSGTTSKPKGVVLRHRNLTSYVLETVEFASAGEDESALMSVPPYGERGNPLRPRRCDHLNHHNMINYRTGQPPTGLRDIP